jgi:hypothetical protein
VGVTRSEKRRTWVVRRRADAGHGVIRQRVADFLKSHQPFDFFSETG